MDSSAAETNSLLASWLHAQTNLLTWSANLTQTRSLKTLTQPLVALGRVAFAAPNRFYWELTNPAPTIAVRQTNEMLILYPKLLRAERYPLHGERAGPWKDTLALLEAGFPRSRAELDARFKVLSHSVSHGVCALSLQPRAAAARRLLPTIQIDFDTRDFTLRATELRFADGSTLRNDFTNTLRNPVLDDALFSPTVGAHYQIVEPLKK